MLTTKSLMSIGVGKIPLCGDILTVFVYACQVKTAGVKKNFENVAAHGGEGGTCLPNSHECIFAQQIALVCGRLYVGYS
jgi:hypothetical protein